jgi:iron complex transport system ATP-binding protein
VKLEAQDLSFAYVPETLALRDISFTLGENEILYVLGRNGSGKTTLLSCLSGVQRPTRGRVLLDGVDIRKHSPSERARQIGLVPQIHVPVFAYTVREMVLMGRAPHLGLFGSPRRADDAIADGALESVGLAHLRDRPYTEISGGERQLVMIARGLAQQSRILLLDEPDAHLDPKNQHLVLEIVVALARQQGLAFIISSHAPNNALFYADRVLLLKEGRTLALGETLATLTASLLSMAYDMETEVIYGSDGGGHIPRAIVPRRPMSGGLD